MLRCITTFVVVAIGALAMVAGAVAGKPDIVNFPPVELVALFQHDCGDYELLLNGTLERRSRFTLDEAGQDVAERRQVQDHRGDLQRRRSHEGGGVPSLDPNRLQLRHRRAGDHRHNPRRAVW